MAESSSRLRLIALASGLLLAAALLGFWLLSGGSPAAKHAPAASASPPAAPPLAPVTPSLPPARPALAPADGGAPVAAGDDLTAIDEQPEPAGPHTVPAPPPMSQIPKPTRPTRSTPEWQRSRQEIALGMLERQVARLQDQLKQALGSKDDDAAKLLRFRIERTQKRHDELAAELAGKPKP